MITPVLPDWFPRAELQRPTADQLEQLDNRKQTLTYAGPNEVIPLVYGEQLVGGPIIAGPAVSGTTLIWAVALCYSGPDGVQRIEDCRVGNTIVVTPAITDKNAGAAVNNSGVTIRVFDGRQSTPYSTLVLAIPGFNDSFNGIAYAILSIPVSSTFSSLPQVTFRIKGRKCEDPRPTLWSPLNLPFNPNDLVAGSAAIIVAAGNSGALSISTDWSSWTPHASGFSSSNILKIGKAGANVTFVVGEGGKLSSTSNISIDGWVPRDSGASGLTIRSAAFTLNSNSLIGGDSGLISSGATNATIWTRRATTLFGTSAILATVVASGSYYAAGEGGKLGRATNITTWDLIDSKFGTSSIRCAVHMANSNTVISDNARLVLLGDDGKVSWTLDGVNYILIDAGFGGSQITHAVYVSPYIYALSSDGKLRSSINGEQWNSIETDGSYRKLFTAMGYLVSIDSSGGAHRVLASDVDSLRWTENPVLHMQDFVKNQEFGMGRNLIGAVDAANIADSLYSGVPRSRTGLTIQDSMTEGDALALFSQYAEVMWSYDGRDVTIIPDAPVNEIFPLPSSEIIENSISLTTVGLSQIPTQIRLMFSDRSEPTWSTRPAIAQIAGHTQHGMPTAPSSVPLPGVFNRAEAERRVWQRLMRLQAPGRISWQMTAPGMPYQAGDVVRLPDIRGLQSVNVRLVAQPTMISPLKYQMAGEIYSASQYPDGGTGTAVPTGAIVPYFGSLPAGYSAWNPATGMLVGDATGGQTLSASTGTINLSFSSAGDHSAPSETFQNAPSSTGTPSGKFFSSNYSSQNRGQHTHIAGLSYASMLETTGMEQVTFAKRTGSSIALNSGLGFLSATEINEQRISAVISAVGRYLAVGPTRISRARISSITGTTSSDGSHNHGSLQSEAATGSGLATVFGNAGAHNHQWTGAIDVSLRSRKLALYEASDETLIPLGGIVGWEDGAPPAGWRLCNGTNGTVDLTGFFIELSTPATAGEIASDVNSINITSISAAGSWAHSHLIQYSGINTTTFGGSSAHSTRNEAHSHSASSQSLSNILPARRTLRFIQYTGA